MLWNFAIKINKLGFPIQKAHLQSMMRRRPDQKVPKHEMAFSFVRSAHCMLTSCRGADKYFWSRLSRTVDENIFTNRFLVFRSLNDGFICRLRNATKIPVMQHLLVAPRCVSFYTTKAIRGKERIQMCKMYLRNFTRFLCPKMSRISFVRLQAVIGVEGGWQLI